MNWDDEPSPEELAEAAALAAALERPAGTATPDEPLADLLPVAALLRDTAAPPLPAARSAALLHQLQRRQAAAQPRPWARWLRWLAPAGALAAASAAAVVLLTGVSSPTPLPPVPAALLRAQAQAATGDEAALAALEDGLRGYRRAWLRSLRASYGEQP